MKQTIPIVIILVALAALVWYYTSNQPAADTESTSQQVTTENDAPAQNTERPSKADAEMGIVGVWQAVDDEKSIVEFKADGTTRDVYDGNELSVGTWSVSEGDVGDTGNAVLLTTTINGSTYEYMVWQVSDNQLVLNYTARGNTLVYTRVE